MFDKESLQITGIIDWETAGWYPEVFIPALWMDLTAPKEHDL
ncbi:hypothetical protein ACJ72_08805, partial [Emergomyces africanus]